MINDKRGKVFDSSSDDNVWMPLKDGVDVFPNMMFAEAFPSITLRENGPIC